MVVWAFSLKKLYGIILDGEKIDMSIEDVNLDKMYYIKCCPFCPPRHFGRIDNEPNLVGKLDTSKKV